MGGAQEPGGSEAADELVQIVAIAIALIVALAALGAQVVPLLVRTQN